MDDRSQDQQQQQQNTDTSPPGPTHEATTPAGNGVRDEDAIRKGEAGLEQAGGGH